MNTSISLSQLLSCDLPEDIANHILGPINTILKTSSNETAWQKLSQEVLDPTLPFALHLLLFSICYPTWQDQPHSAAAWIPSKNFIDKTHLYHWMNELSLFTVRDFHAWTIKNFEDFWLKVIKKIGIVFKNPPQKCCDLSQGIKRPHWLPHATFNIVDSCFKASPSKTAIVSQRKGQPLRSITYRELEQLSNRIANSLIHHQFRPNDFIAIDMPMTIEAVAIYLGIIKMGAVVVSIADSFSKDEIAARLRIAKAKAIFTQDYILRDNKQLPLYEKVAAAQAPTAIVLACKDDLDLKLRENDLCWKDFLLDDNHFESYPCNAMTHCNVLFSSGTTGDPKAIPWTHSTTIKAASDGYLHHDIQENDRVAWPTNLGWMMGPWLIFATLINNASIALYDGLPREREFGTFIQDAKVTILGVVPTLVAAWRQTRCMQGIDWSHIKLFTSTGECSNAEDMLYLMSLAGYKPVIEYCGGTEIGGSYITSTLIEKNYPSVFTTPAMGLDFVLLDEQGNPSDVGEVALIPPSMGLSTELLNGDHDKIYYENMPTSHSGKMLRRHGDQLQKLSEDRYMILGRVDDTMNLGGIKVSSVEIERTLVGIDHISETAAVGVNVKKQGPTSLIIFATTDATLEKDIIQKNMQERINTHLNPLFKITDVIFLKNLPKTASNKIMRKVLRNQYYNK